MSYVLTRLPESQLQPLLAVYDGVQRARRLRLAAALAILVFCLVAAAVVAGVDFARFAEGVGRFGDYFDRILKLDSGARIWTDPGEWLWGWSKWLVLLGDTLLIAYLGTAIAAVGAFFLCFAASANLGRTKWLRFVIRRFFEFCRTVPELVFALVFVIAFGLGPMPGVLALAIHSLGALGKLFYEIVENIDLGPVHGLEATGAGFAQTVRFAAVPQVLPGFFSYALLRFEINVRGAAVMGFVGAGGIGQELIEAVRKFYYSDVSAILLLIILTVFVIDVITARMRAAVMSSGTRS